ncbi:MAG: hypothetical protein IJ700_08040 [Bacteroidaceae bacterium]|nr:hypothetical protein [Bacteroidaceae bacterium]
MGNKVYVQGSYVDVHDNKVVNLSIDKAGRVNVARATMDVEDVEGVEGVEGVEDIEGVEGVEDAAGRVGRPRKGEMAEVMCGDEAVRAARLARLRPLLEGQQARRVALVVACALERGWLAERPSFEQMRQAFHIDCAASSYYRQLSLADQQTQQERHAVMALLGE